MPLSPVNYLSDQEIAERATHVIRKYEQQRGRRVSLPVPVESMLEHVLRLRVVWVEIEEAPGEIILARIDPDFQGHPTVQMNERRAAHFEQYFGTEAYSMGHEGGHWVLHFDHSSTA